jgi:hypothetical protein
VSLLKYIMKHLPKFKIYFLLISIFSFGCYNKAFGQEKVNISVGVGWPELWNIGARYQHNQFQFGMNLCPIPAIFAISGNAYYHWGLNAKKSTRHPLYVKGGVTYQPFEYSKIWFNSCMGIDINITRRAGINFEAGLSLSPKKISFLIPSSTGIGSTLPTYLLPSFGIYFFYRIIKDQY